MGKVLYQESGDFFLLDYNPSHSELVIRSIKKGNNVKNHDFFFKGVSFLNLSSKFRDIEISEIENRKDFFEHNRLNFLDYDLEEKLYSIKDSNGSFFYISAYFFCVFENTFDILESPLGKKLWTSENKKLFSST